jgi:hypothetical protein
VRPDDNVVETGSIVVKGYFVIGPLVQIVLGERIQLGLSRLGKIEDIRLFE